MKLPRKKPKRDSSISVNATKEIVDKLNSIVEETGLPKGRIIESWISQYKLSRNN